LFWREKNTKENGHGLAEVRSSNRDNQNRRTEDGGKAKLERS
jgi:hypothetical protein